jgi:Protein of unknown function (DUF1579)
MDAQPALAIPARRRLASPGAETERLTRLAGYFNVRATLWKAPDDQPVHSDALQARLEIDLRGRYLRDEVLGTLDSLPFHRRSITGFNALTGRFERVSWESNQPGITLWTGADKDAEPLTFHGHYTEAGFGEAVTGQAMVARFVLSQPDQDLLRFLLHVRPPGGEEFLHQRFDLHRIA